MKLVNENIYNFHKTGDVKSSLDIGKNSKEFKISILEDLKKEGIGFPEGLIESEKIDHFLENFEDFIFFIDCLKQIGYPMKDIWISGPSSIDIEIISIAIDDKSLFYVLDSSDANYITDKLKLIVIPNYLGLPEVRSDKSVGRTIWFTKDHYKKWISDLRDLKKMQLDESKKSI